MEVSGSRQQADEGGNESLPRPLSDIPVSAVTAAAQRQRVGQPVGGWLPSKSEKNNKAKAHTHTHTQSPDMHHYTAGRLKWKFSWFHLSLTGLI